jgi:hypothetical protein
MKNEVILIIYAWLIRLFRTAEFWVVWEAHGVVLRLPVTEAAPAYAAYIFIPTELATPTEKTCSSLMRSSIQRLWVWTVANIWSGATGWESLVQCYGI